MLIWSLYARDGGRLRGGGREEGGSTGEGGGRIDEVEAKDRVVEFVAIPNRADGRHLVVTVAVV